MNLAVVSRRRLTSTLDSLERSSNYGLFALAVSDLLICLVAISHRQYLHGYQPSCGTGPVVYFVLQGLWSCSYQFIHDISMWQVVSMTVHRYMIVVYPLQVRLMLISKQTSLSIAIVYTVSVIQSSPHFMFLKIDCCYHGFERITNSNLYSNLYCLLHTPPPPRSISDGFGLSLQSLFLLSFCWCATVRRAQQESAGQS